MKNKLILVPMISLAFVALTGCADKKVNLTYGTYLPQNVESLKAIGDMDIFFRTEYYNETFIVATYQSDYSEDCLCWSTFKQVIVNYMNKYHEKVYLFDTKNDTAERLKMDRYQDSTPALYVYHGTKQLAKFTYKNSQDKTIFTELNAETMYERIHKHVSKPGLFEVNDEYLSNNLSKMDEAITLFISHTRAIIPSAVHFDTRPIPKLGYLVEGPASMEAFRSDAIWAYTSSAEERGRF